MQRILSATDDDGMMHMMVCLWCYEDSTTVMKEMLFFR